MSELQSETRTDSDPEMEAKSVSHKVYAVLSDANTLVGDAMTDVNSEHWDYAQGNVDKALELLGEARDKIAVALEKHGVRD